MKPSEEILLEKMRELMELLNASQPLSNEDYALAKALEHSLFVHRLKKK